MYKCKTAAFLVIFLVAAIAVPASVRAGPHHLAVVGDSIATGIYFGLRDALGRSGSAILVRRTKGATGLAPQDHYNWIAAARRIKQNDRPGSIVICLGGNDRQDMFVGSKRLRRFTDAWWAEYAKRVDTFMKTLAADGTPVFWVGLPTVRTNSMSRDYARLNAVYEEQSRKNGVTYIDTFAITALSDGSSGRQLRDKDGVHFSSYGNLVLGRIILRVIAQTTGASG